MSNQGLIKIQDVTIIKQISKITIELSKVNFKVVPLLRKKIK